MDRSQGSVSVGHEDLLGMGRFLDSSTPRPEVFAFQAHSDRVVTRSRPTCPISTPRSLGNSGSGPTDLRGLGTLNAEKILARVGDVERFRSAAAFASPLETSSVPGTATQVLPSHHGHHPAGLCPRPDLSPTQTRQRQVPQGSPRAA